LITTEELKTAKYFNFTRPLKDMNRTYIVSSILVLFQRVTVCFIIGKLNPLAFLGRTVLDVPEN
jgi:hypothetical protein